MSNWTKKASKGGDGNYEKAPPGNHPAVCVGMIDLGTQLNNYQGNEKYEHRVYFVWELVGEKNTEGKNFLLGIDLNISLSELAKLRKWIEARTGQQIPDGAEYDISAELGKPCLLNVIHKNGYPKIDSLSSLPKGMPTPVSTITPVALTLDEIKAGATIPAWVPWSYGEPISEIVKRCEEWKDGGGQAPKQATPKAAAPTASMNQPAPPANKPAPPNKPKPPGGPVPGNRKFWCALPDGEVVEFMESQAMDFLTGKGLDQDQVQVTPDGVEDWKPASAYGLRTAF